MRKSFFSCLHGWFLHRLGRPVSSPSHQQDLQYHWSFRLMLVTSGYSWSGYIGVAYFWSAKVIFGCYWSCSASDHRKEILLWMPSEYVFETRFWFFWPKIPFSNLFQICIKYSFVGWRHIKNAYEYSTLGAILKWNHWQYYTSNSAILHDNINPNFISLRYSVFVEVVNGSHFEIIWKMNLSNFSQSLKDYFFVDLLSRPSIKTNEVIFDQVSTYTFKQLVCLTVIDI